jgi:single-strand selective monofunctional uracil DNA glycosylase
VSAALISRTRRFCKEVSTLSFAAPVDHVYNPLDYARAVHEAYLRRFGSGRKRVVFLGMNPGPFGMVQTGVPFGEVGVVREWLKLRGQVHAPQPAYAPRPIDGMACTRSEVSGLRLWTYLRERFGSPEAFFRDHFVANYCPLAFFTGARNVTPDKLRAAERDPLFAICDAYLRDAVDLLQPQWIVGIGGFAAERARSALAGRPVRIGRILHPSPASPAANRGWARAAHRQLEAMRLNTHDNVATR